MGKREESASALPSPRGIILFELNEVPWRILDDHVASHPASSLARILPISRAFTSITADAGKLEPWTSWPTLERGVNDEKHLIRAFGQDLVRANEEFPPVWELLHRAGVSVGICGSLHSFPPPDDFKSYSFYVPDSFASTAVAFPRGLQDFQRFNLAMARASGRNVDTSFSRRDAMRFLMAAPKLGIKTRTFAAIARQLAAERRAPWLSNRRRSLQSVLAFDLFEKQLTTRRPAFSTFFTNHVASAMHRYWAASHPDDYDVMHLDEEWRRKFREEVPWAMTQADIMIGKLAAFVEANPTYQLWIASSMGQAATMAEPIASQLFVADPTRFMTALGIPSDAWVQRPAMLPFFNVQVAASHVNAFATALDTLRVSGSPLDYAYEADGFFKMEWGHPNLHDRSEIMVAGAAYDINSLGLRSTEIDDRSGTTAYHVPEGVLAIYDPSNPQSGPSTRRSLSVLEIAPALLHYFDVAIPDYMHAIDELSLVESSELP